MNGDPVDLLGLICSVIRRPFVSAEGRRWKQVMVKPPIMMSDCTSSEVHSITVSSQSTKKCHTMHPCMPEN